MSLNASLLSIIAHARSGALAHAWHLFREGGFDRARKDPAALSVRGRLLKDDALRVEGAARKRLYLQAADAYARAGKISGETYPLINAATLSLLAGRRKQAHTLARRVLDRRGSERETPYYRIATRAEALLLLGEVAQARTTLASAMVRAPHAYEDHASTLRQFSLILYELGESKTWLDAFRPPRCLHFAGHMGVAAGGAAIAREIRAVIRKERVGFGYGALAAGADILIAEALLEAGAELHLVLPAPEAMFREASVARFGKGWARRFDRVLRKAHSIRIAGSEGPPSPLAIQLAAEVAMGRAAMQAATLSTEAVQLLILDRKDKKSAAAGGSVWIASTWKRGGRRQLILAAPRARAARHASAKPAPGILAAMLRIEMSVSSGERLTGEILPWLARALKTGARPLMAPRWTGDAVLAAFSTPHAAAQAALSAASVMAEKSDLRVAGHYAIVEEASDPFGGAVFLTGPGAALPREIAKSTPYGAIHLSEDFAAALHAGAVRPRTEFVGELRDDAGCDVTALFSLKR